MQQTTKKRITLVMAGDEEGGLEKHVVELAAGLLARGHAVSLIAHEKYRARLADGIVFYAVNLARGRRNPLALLQLWYALRQSDAQIIHAHGNKAAFMVGRLLRFFAAHSVATLHSKKNNTRMFAPFNQVIAVSAVAAEAIDHPRVVVVLNGIVPPQIRPIAKCEPPMVLAVGRLVPVKGFDVLLEAWRQVAGVAQLWIAGEGSEYARLQGLIAQYGLQHRVRLLGQRDDIEQLMQQAALFVMSSHYEGCPYTMIEALLCHTPMVSTAVGAMRDILPPAYLCAVNQSQDLATVLADSLAHLPRVQHDFLAVFAWAEQHLSMNGMLDQIEQVYLT